ncbi:TraR/DksA C4-type zinc finger protein [Streptomyces sp. NPDC005805]|uniref:TraR/DksA family transcriptional regulator n=1 Tax=Streptomyces sp. NPDC005805 TaxID=3157068 RepID=UPI00340B4339
MVAKKTAKRASARGADGAAPAESEAPPAKKATAKKTAAKKAVKKTAKRAASAAGPGAQAAAKKAPAKKATAKKTTARKAAAKKTTAGGPAAARKTAADGTQAAPAAEGAAQAAEQTGASTVGTKKTAVKAPTAAATPPDELAVRPGEDPWTATEVAGARADLESEATRLTAEITAAESALVGMMRDSNDGAGDDEADTGTKNITREHEMALAANAREMLEQTERALERLDAGTYGLCESCGKAIGKARMQAFPRATLCVECKQKQERRG